MKVEVSFTISVKRSSDHCDICQHTVQRKQEYTNLGSVHLVDGDDELPDTEGEGKQSVLSGLSILGDTGFEFTSSTSNDKDSAIGLGGTSDHVLDEITVTRGIDDLDSVEMISRQYETKTTKLLTVTMNLGVSNFQRAISMVIPPPLTTSPTK